MIEVQNLHKSFTTINAVNDVSFRVEPERVFGLLGPNGAGKTTIIRMIINIIRPDSGEIYFAGKPFNPQLRNAVGYLPEERGLYRKNKLITTIQYFAGLKGIGSREAKRRAVKWLERFDLLPYINNKIEELSKGNQQKIQFIVSILHDPQYIILDEPFSGLDPVNQIVLKDIIETLRSLGKVIIFSTHQMEQAEKICDEVCIINKGRVVLNGPLNEEKRKFGTNSILVEFEGNGTVLKQLEGIKHLSLYSNYAELDLETGIQPRDILFSLGKQLDIRKFEVKEPTLNAIFLRLVGVTVEEIEKEHQHKTGRETAV
jgi:ABC-2 type transport system ATP-binding protein